MSMRRLPRASRPSRLRMVPSTRRHSCRSALRRPSKGFRSISSVTDSGGFQIFSLARLVKITEEQAVFRSHIDGSLVELSPERAVAIQEALGADVAMVLDHVVALPSEPDAVRDASQRTTRWAQRRSAGRARVRCPRRSVHGLAARERERLGDRPRCGSRRRRAPRLPCRPRG